MEKNSREIQSKLLFAVKLFIFCTIVFMSLSNTSYADDCDKYATKSYTMTGSEAECKAMMGDSEDFYQHSLPYQCNIDWAIDPHVKDEAECTAKGGTLYPNEYKCGTMVIRNALAQGGGKYTVSACKAKAAQCAEQGKVIHMETTGMTTISCQDPPPDSSCFYPAQPSEFVKNMSKMCWFCEPFQTIIKVIEEIAKEVYAKVKPATLNLLGALFLVWVALKVFAFVGSMEAKDSGEFLTDLLIAAGRTIIAAVAINESEAIWTHIVAPVAGFAFDYSKAALDVSSEALTISGGAISTADPIGGIGDRIVGSADTNGGILALINSHMMGMIGTGWVVSTLAMNMGWFCLPFTEFLLFFSGLLLMLMGIVFLFIIPFKAIDICFKFAVFLIFLPLFILGWVFPATRFFTKGGIELLVNSFGILLVYAIVVALCTQIVSDALKLPTLTNDVKTTEENVKTFYNATISSILISIAFVIFSFEILKVTSAIAIQLFSQVSVDSGIAGGASMGAMLLSKATTKLGGATARLGGAVAQSQGRKAVAGTKNDAKVRAYSDKLKAESLVSEYKSASKGGFSASPHGLKEVKMPPSVAKALRADPNYKLTKEDVSKVLKENRYRNKGIKGFMQDFKDNKKKDFKEKFYAKITGEKASDYY